MNYENHTLTYHEVLDHSNLEWQALTVDGLKPGMSFEAAIDNTGWQPDQDNDDFIVSSSFGKSEIGMAYSMAEIYSGCVSAVSGKVLKFQDLVVFEVGCPWSRAKDLLSWDGKSDLKSQDGKLGLLLVVGNKGVVEAIRLTKIQQ